MRATRGYALCFVWRAVIRVSGKISVVLRTRNGADRLLRTVERTLALPERPAVVVVDNGSTDDTPLRLKERFPQVKLVRLPLDFGAASRNIGVQCAETPYVAFGDDGAVWEPGSLAIAAGMLDFYLRVAALAGRVLEGPDGREDRASVALAES